VEGLPDGALSPPPPSRRQRGTWCAPCPLVLSSTTPHASFAGQALCAHPHQSPSSPVCPDSGLITSRDCANQVWRTRDGQGLRGPRQAWIETGSRNPCSRSPSLAEAAPHLRLIKRGLLVHRRVGSPSTSPSLPFAPMSRNQERRGGGEGGRSASAADKGPRRRQRA
jgi:hypothetical protein